MASSPAPPPAFALLQLHQSAGNAAVARLLEPTEEAAGAQPLLRSGSRGPAVSDCQAKLNVAVPPAAPSLKVDTIFGPLTKGAVVDFQSGNDLKPDGIVGPLTRAALDAQQQVPPEPVTPEQIPPSLVPPQQVPPQQVPPVVSVPGPLSPQEQADAVAFNSGAYDAQSVRIIQGRVGINPTGVFDAATAQAVARFQQTHNLPDDGRVDDATLTPMVVDRARDLMHDHAIHLVADLNDLDLTTDTLSAHFDASFGGLSNVRFETGNLRLIRLGPGAFASSTVLRDQLLRQLQAPAPAVGASGPAPAVIDPVNAQITALLNGNKLGDPRSIRIIQGLVGAPPDGVWSPDLVQRVAFLQQQSAIPANGFVDDARTLPAMTAGLLTVGDNDAVLQLIADYYDFRSDGNLTSIYFDPSIGTGRVADAFVRRDPEQPGSIQVGPNGMALPFAGLVHVIAHEMTHVRQLVGGPADDHTREFLAREVSLLSEGIPEEAIEPHDQIPNPHPPFGFANDARRALNEWNDMPLADRRQHRDRFIRVHDKIQDRIRPGTPEATTHAVLLDRWRQARASLPPASN